VLNYEYLSQLISFDGRKLRSSFHYIRVIFWRFRFQMWAGMMANLTDNIYGLLRLCREITR